MLRQINAGFGNQNTTQQIEIKNGVVVFNQNSEYSCTISELWRVLVNQFELKDKEINAQLPCNVLVNKTQGTEKFNSSKIMSSLMKIGIPFPCAVEIVENTISAVESWINENKGRNTQLTTKHIRQIISSIIQELDGNKWSRIDIEKWNAQYVRRYGHNNRIIQIYAIPSEISAEPVVNISYDFVRKNLLNDIIHSLFPDVDVYKELSSRSLSDMADEIIAFVNNCDLYSIKYSVLKDFITEIATQLPHPWFISENKRANNIQHDKKSVEDNLRLAENAYNKGEPLPTNLIVELLHHASSLVLEKYFSFMGCYDLTAFYRLAYIINKLSPHPAKENLRLSSSKHGEISEIEETEWDIVISDFAFKNLFDDCTMAGVQLSVYGDKINRIHNLLEKKKTSCRDFTSLLIDFAKLSLEIHIYGDRSKIVKFLDDDWHEYSTCDIRNNIKTILLLLFPHRRHKSSQAESSHSVSYTHLTLPTT